jgi:hypothetical protein
MPPLLSRHHSQLEGNSMTIRHGLTAVLLSIAASGALALAAPVPAMADSFNGVCESREVCVWDNVGFTGSRADFFNNVSNYGGWHFWNSPYWLANNVESAKNLAIYSCVDFLDAANYSGADVQYLASDSESGNFDSGNNRAESHQFTNAFPNECDL